MFNSSIPSRRNVKITQRTHSKIECGRKGMGLGREPIPNSPQFPHVLFFFHFRVSKKNTLSLERLFEVHYKNTSTLSSLFFFPVTIQGQTPANFSRVGGPRLGCNYMMNFSPRALTSVSSKMASKMNLFNYRYKVFTQSKSLFFPG